MIPSAKIAERRPDGFYAAPYMTSLLREAGAAQGLAGQRMADAEGRATPVFLRLLGRIAGNRPPLGARLVNSDGTPTLAFVRSWPS